MSDAKPVYIVDGDKDPVLMNCQHCGSETPVWGAATAYSGTWIRKTVTRRVKIAGSVIEESSVVRLLARKRITVCPVCADEYNSQLIHAKSGHQPALMVRRVATTGTITAKPAHRIFNL